MLLIYIDILYVFDFVVIFSWQTRAGKQQFIPIDTIIGSAGICKPILHG